MKLDIFFRKPSIVLMDFKPGEKMNFSKFLRNPEVSREYVFHCLKKLEVLKLVFKPGRAYYQLTKKGEKIHQFFTEIKEGIK